VFRGLMMDNVRRESGDVLLKLSLQIPTSNK
jgi:hypothetical protein